MSYQPPVFLVQSGPADRLRAACRISSLVNLMPPVGLLSIAAYLRAHGIGTEVFDLNAYPANLPALKKRLLEKKPRYLGISCVTSTFNGAVMVASAAKKILPEIAVIFGGPHVSALKKKILDECPVVDALIAGEGEKSFLEFVSAGLENAPHIGGVVYRDHSGVSRFTGYRSDPVELDELPYPAYDALEGFPGRYGATLFNYPETPGASIISSRGCPYACSYCDRSVFRRSFRYNSAEYLYDHMRFLRASYGIRHLIFYDDQFTFNRERVVELCSKLIKKPVGMTFNCAVRAEHIDPPLLRHMKRAGCWMVSIGIESGDPVLLAKHRSGTQDISATTRCIRWIKDAGIRAKGLFMMGLPGETEESVRRSREFAFSLPLDDLNLTKFTPFPGSPLYERAHELGLFDEDWDRMDCMSFQFVPEGLTRERLEQLYGEFYRAHFKRPGVWLHYLKMLSESPDSWRRFLAHAGHYLKFAINT